MKATLGAVNGQLVASFCEQTMNYAVIPKWQNGRKRTPQFSIENEHEVDEQ